MKLSTTFRQDVLKKHLSNDFYQIITGKYEGRIGKIEDVPGKSLGNTMFYPIEGEYPYRVCVPFSEIKKVECDYIRVDKIKIRESH